MKRLGALMLLLCLLPLTALSQNAEALPKELTLAVGETRVFSLPFDGYWDCDAWDVVSAEGGTITALAEGSAVLCLISDDAEFQVEITVGAADDVPPLIRSAIDLALQEWQDHLGKTFTQRNKYTAWYCGTGPKCYFGWCGGFVSYCLDTAGVPMDDKEDCVPHEGGVPYAVREASVGKLYTGFQKMERLSPIPRPGYLVIYGKWDRYAYTHIGMVTDVVDRGDGTYQIFTVEGNVSSRIKRYSYIYDTNAKPRKNMSDTPEALRTDPGTFQYTKHQKDWYINIFCQTWQ